MDRQVRPLKLTAAQRELRVLFIAKHARWCGGLHPEDGNHAVYHREMRQTLEAAGVNLLVADDYRVMFDPPQLDFVFPLLNRGGFLNSEMMLPLLCNRLGVPYLGASPIVRGLSDDKHLSKRAAVARGVATAPWAIYRRGAPLDAALCPPAPRYVVKPNASSASWGVGEASDWTGVRAAVARLHDEGHDAIVEPFIEGHDIEVPVITVGGEPFILPAQIVEQDEPDQLRTYEEKRSLAAETYHMYPVEDAGLVADVGVLSRRLLGEFFPFDYGRFEFRMDTRTGRLWFLEVNLNCNLWSRKSISLGAGLLGWSHGELIETILAESLTRQGLVGRRIDVAA
ncbi:MAG: phosphoribosylglycinamide synthetase [Phenylobacterium zucineum]|nr:MAG: phosphoribosylglycinamide synthetase [Phenylobacterium zucineum]